MTENHCWSEAELAIIRTEQVPMRILTIHSEEDNRILRKVCDDLTDQQLLSDEYKLLSKKMLATVDYPGSGGVGVAAPQVGLSYRMVALQRQDKKEKPFEVYANLRIIECKGEKQRGREGCLSVPDKRGWVERYRDIRVQYTIPETLEIKTERIKGFTAVIFQHECEHLDGKLYIDQCDELIDFVG